MNRIVKLLIAVLVSGFLGGCGGSSGGGSENPISFAGITASFPAFDDSNLTLDNIYSSKGYYSVANTSVYDSALNASGSGFSLGYSDTSYNQYSKSISASLSALAQVYSSDTIYLDLHSDPTVTHTDALYNSIFPAIDEEIGDVYFNKYYTSDATAEFTAYFALLDSSWTKTGNNITYWHAEKTGANGLTYYVHAEVPNPTDSYIEWIISK